MQMIKPKEFELGKDLWYEYQNLNGYSFEPKSAGLSLLSKKKGIKKKEITRLINVFLQA
jgi:hypothetical protein